MRALLPLVVLLSACGSPAEVLSSEEGPTKHDRHVARLRAALARATVSLADAVPLAEDAGGLALRASLIVDAIDTVDVAGAPAAGATNDAAVYSVGTKSDAGRDVRVDIVTGDIVSAASVPSLPRVCPSAPILRDAIFTAESFGGGAAVQIEPDDDRGCSRETQVLRNDKLWELIVGPDGDVVSEEESDEPDEDGDG